MVDIAKLERVLEQEHADTDLVAMPISLVREIVEDLRSLARTADPQPAVAQ